MCENNEISKRYIWIPIELCRKWRNPLAIKQKTPKNFMTIIYQNPETQLDNGCRLKKFQHESWCDLCLVPLWRSHIIVPVILWLVLVLVLISCDLRFINCQWKESRRQKGMRLSSCTTNHNLKDKNVNRKMTETTRMKDWDRRRFHVVFGHDLFCDGLWFQRFCTIPYGSWAGDITCGLFLCLRKM